MRLKTNLRNNHMFGYILMIVALLLELICKFHFTGPDRFTDNELICILLVFILIGIGYMTILMEKYVSKTKI